MKFEAIVFGFFLRSAEPSRFCWLLCRGLWAAFRGIAKVALPGHYSVPNSALVISSLDASNGKAKSPSCLSRYHATWSNYSDLTRPISPKR